jgi:hypothetical protein
VDVNHCEKSPSGKHRWHTIKTLATFGGTDEWQKCPYCKQEESKDVIEYETKKEDSQ